MLLKKEIQEGKNSPVEIPYYNNNKNNNSNNNINNNQNNNNNISRIVL